MERRAGWPSRWPATRPVISPGHSRFLALWAAERSEGLPGTKTWVLGTDHRRDGLTFRFRTMPGAIDDVYNLAVARAQGCITH
jgi:hypothetical protein